MDSPDGQACEEMGSPDGQACEEMGSPDGRQETMERRQPLIE